MNEGKIPGFPGGIGAKWSLLDVRDPQSPGPWQEPQTTPSRAKLGVSGFGPIQGFSFCSSSVQLGSAMAWDRDTLGMGAWRELELGTAPFVQRRMLGPLRPGRG